MLTRRRNDTLGLIHPDGFEARPHYASLVINDGTGVVLTTPTSATAITGAPMALGEANGATPLVSAGSLTISRPGRYRIGFHAGELVGVNNQALTLEVYKNGAVITNAILAKITQPATALAIVSLSAEGIENLERDDVLVLRATGSTGNVTVKRLRFFAVQLDDDVTVPPAA